MMAKKSSLAFTPQMTLPDSNLSSIDYTECSGNNRVSALEPLFDKLVKKALANDLIIRIWFNIKCNVARMERRSGFSEHPSGRK